MVLFPDAHPQIKAEELLGPALGATSSDYTVALNLASTVPHWLTAIGAKPMTLGLDLQGGVHFLMEVDQNAARTKREEAYADEIRATLRDAQIRYGDASRSGDGVLVRLSNAADRPKAMTLLARQMPKLVFTEVEDGQGLSLRGTVTPEEIKAIADGAIEQNVT